MSCRDLYLFSSLQCSRWTFFHPCRCTQLFIVKSVRIFICFERWGIIIGLWVGHTPLHNTPSSSVSSGDIDIIPLSSVSSYRIRSFLSNCHLMQSLAPTLPVTLNLTLSPTLVILVYSKIKGWDFFYPRPQSSVKTSIKFVMIRWKIILITDELRYLRVLLLLLLCFWFTTVMSNLVKKSDCLTLSSEGIMVNGRYCLSLQ